MPTAIEFDNVGKQYRLGLVSTQTLSHDLHRWWTVNVRHKEDPYLRIGDTNDRSVKGSSDYVWALKDISFKVEQGDVVGIIGRNGAGKSTLLKLLSKVTGPSTGRIRARGRIGSLLEVGTGFHPEMTGRENIFMNGAILGMTKAEVARKLDEIVDFSGCERYLDTPVKRYSSGMMVRLGFAVAAHLDPEILVVDEVLAVGDAEFQKKAIGKMKDVSQGQGRTVLFVSHNMASIKNLCRRGVVLNQGLVIFDGAVNEAVDFYTNTAFSHSDDCYYDDLTKAPGNENIRIRSLSVKAADGGVIDMSSDIVVELQFHNYKENALIDATFELRTVEDVIVFHQGKIISPNKDSKEGEYRVTLHIPPYLINAGRYMLKVWFGENCRYLLWGTMEYSFEIEHKRMADGLDVGYRPGIIASDMHFVSEFVG